MLKEIRRIASILLQTLRFILRFVPPVNTLLFFPPRLHARVFSKFIVLTALTTLPIFFAALLEIRPAQGMVGTFFDNFYIHLTEAGIFIYVASFIPPFFVIATDKLNQHRSERNNNSGNIIFDGYIQVAFIALLLFTFSAFSFGAMETGSKLYNNTFLEFIINKHSIYFYLFSLYCWYLTLLDTANDGIDLLNTRRKNENSLIDGFGDRVNPRG